MKIVNLKAKDLKEAGIPFTVRTLYKWHSTGEHPELFLKLGKKLCIDMKAWNNWIESARLKANQRTEKLNRLKRG